MLKTHGVDCAVRGSTYTCDCGVDAEYAADAQAIMRINNRLREALLQIGTVCADNAAASCNHAMALNFVRQIVTATVKP